jgi:ABC-type antimicrobial peptide transport system permease subunit
VLTGYATTAVPGSLPLLGPMFKNKGAEGDIHLQISTFAVITSTIMLQVVGLIAGLLPAVKASRPVSIEALRYE